MDRDSRLWAQFDSNDLMGHAVELFLAPHMT